MKEYNAYNDIIDKLDNLIIYITYSSRNNLYSQPIRKSSLTGKSETTITGTCPVTESDVSIKIKDVIGYTVHGDIDSPYDNILRTSKIISDQQSLYNVSTSYAKTIFFRADVTEQDIELVNLFDIKSINKFKNNDSSLLTQCKNKWIKRIEEYRKKSISYLQGEIERVSDLETTDEVNKDTYTIERESIEEILDMVTNISFADDLTNIKRIEDLGKYWPAILLPAPDFVLNTTR